MTRFVPLSAQTALCNWPIEQVKATLEELFIGRIRNIDVQRQLVKAKVNLENTLQLALESKKGAKTSEQLQKLLPHNQSTTPNTNSIRIKQEPTFSVQQFRNPSNIGRGGGHHPSNQRPSQSKP